MEIKDWKVDQGIELSDQFKEVLNLMEFTKQSMFITGKAGAGKSTLLKVFRNNTRKQHMIVAPTGIAAVNITGQTIHSVFRFPPQIIFPDTVKHLKGEEIFRKLEVLIIDEISMVRADLLDGINRFLMLNGPDPRKPFGGVQVIMFGDLYQLPPVITDKDIELFYRIYKTPYFFEANAFKDADIKVIELKKIYRQTDEKFLALLEKLRTNKMEQEDYDTINKNYNPFEPRPAGEYAITLTTINEVAREINANKLAAIDAEEWKFDATVTGIFKKDAYPAEVTVTLKEGAQVIFLKNDSTKRWVNGTLGIVKKISNDRIRVQVNTEFGPVEYDVERAEWDNIKYEEDHASGKIYPRKIGSFKQFPLKLAWVITIHKSQGQTFDNVDLHFGYGAFAHGQIYVAFSRCRTFEGIKLMKRLEPRDVILDPRIEEFLKEYLEEQENKNNNKMF